LEAREQGRPVRRSRQVALHAVGRVGQGVNQLRVAGQFAPAAAAMSQYAPAGDLARPWQEPASSFSWPIDSVPATETF
ncbi:MAG: hypothetical protein ACJ8F7_09850, partial [Gemmataceae bacterium]